MIIKNLNANFSKLKKRFFLQILPKDILFFIDFEFKKIVQFRLELKLNLRNILITVFD